MDERRPSSDEALNAVADAFERLRPRLFGIAYRVLGSMSQAEDAVQDVWVRRQGADRSTVLDQGAFLAKITRSGWKRGARCRRR
ncbi:sigma factor [Streptomyces paradoxus]